MEELDSIKELMNLEDLSEDDLKKIPACSATSLLAYFDYTYENFHIEKEKLLYKLSISYEYLKDSRNWVNAYDVRLMKKNFYNLCNKLFTHHDYRKIGTFVVKQKSSLLVLTGLVVPPEILLKKINQLANRFNNEYIIDSYFLTDYTLVTIKDYPYFKKADPGWACYFVLGVIEGPFILSKYKYEISHVICSKRVEWIILNNYPDLTYTEQNGIIYLNGESVASRVKLIQANLGFKLEYIGKYILDPNGDAIIFNKDYVYQDRIIFFRGEIYNAPYCVIKLTWKKRFISKILSIYKPYNKMLTFEALSKQLEFSNDKLMEAEQNAENFRRLNEELEIIVNKRTLELKNALDLIAQQSKDKTNFFVNLAHETRTPATLMLNYLNKCLQKYPADNDLLIVKVNLEKHIRDMINFLDAEKIQQSRLTYDEIYRFNLSEYLNSKSDFITPSAESKGINIVRDIPYNIEITSNMQAIDRILNNLLDNAMRYTSKGGFITVKLTQINDDNLSIDVSDTGVGIPLEKQEHIFEKYYQVSNKKGNTQGIGMGLFITKSIVEILGGTISFKSSNKGTTFSVNLPKGSSNATVCNEYYVQNNYSYQLFHDLDNSDISFDKNKSTVLLIEDNRELLLSMKESLSLDFNILYGFNGQNGIEILSSNRPDIIVSDIMMDTMDGYDFLEQVRKNTQTVDIPFVFLTAKSGISEEIRGLTSGAIDYIQKPFAVELLKARIHSLLDYNNLKKKTFELEKYKSIGLLTASICHEILNPLSGISGNVYIVDSEVEKSGVNNSIIKESIDHIKDNYKRISDIVSTMRALFSGKKLPQANIEISSIIEPIINIYKNKVGNRIRIDYKAKNHAIITDRSALTQILFNLISNAIESIKQEGYMQVDHNLESNTIIIKDSGCGIPSEELIKIYDIGYTTKPNGTGIGLFVVKELCVQLGYKITIESKINEGSTITIHL